MNDKYVKVIYQTPPIGEYGIVLELTTFDFEAQERDEKEKQLLENRQFERLNINPNEPLEIIEQRLNAKVDAFYRKEIENLKTQLEWYIRNTAVPKMTLPEWHSPKTLKNINNSENIYCDVIKGNVVNCENVHCKEIYGNIVNSEIYKED